MITATYRYYVDWNGDGDFSDANENISRVPSGVSRTYGNAQHFAGYFDYPFGERMLPALAQIDGRGNFTGLLWLVQPRKPALELHLR